MFPIGDDDTGVRTVPVVTYGLIAGNILFFLVEMNGGDEFIQQWAFIPSRFTENPATNWPTIFTAMNWPSLFFASITSVLSPKSQRLHFAAQPHSAPVPPMRRKIAVA